MDDLGNSLQGLVAAAQMTMSSVHNLETAILLQPSYQWYLSEIPILRHNLAHHWNEIVDVLQGSYKLVNDLFTICQSMGRHSYLSRIQFLQTYMNSISTVETNWQASITRNDDIQLHFASTTVRFNEQGQTNSDLARLPPPPGDCLSIFDDEIF
jgi:hypothetical protein